MEVFVCVVFGLMVVVTILNIVSAVWCAKIASKDNRNKTTVIYGVYSELKRFNDASGKSGVTEHD